MADAPLLDVRVLGVAFRQEGAVTTAVEGASFTVGKGETVALVGESGSGKSVTALSILSLLPQSAFHPAGEILFKGRDLLKAREKELRAVRGNDISIVFQEPMTSLNPLHSIERQVSEVLKIHRGMHEHAARERTLELFRRAREIDPAHFSHPQLTLAEIYVRRGDRESALAELRDFLKRHPDSPQAAAAREKIANLSR